MKISKKILYASVAAEHAMYALLARLEQAVERAGDQADRAKALKDKASKP